MARRADFSISANPSPALKVATLSDYYKMSIVRCICVILVRLTNCIDDRLCPGQYIALEEDIPTDIL